MAEDETVESTPDPVPANSIEKTFGYKLSANMGWKYRLHRAHPSDAAQRHYERIRITNEMRLAECGVGDIVADSYWCQKCGGLIIAEWCERTGSSWSLCPCGDISGAPKQSDEVAAEQTNA